MYPKSIMTFLTMALSFRVTPTAFLISSAVAGGAICFSVFFLRELVFAARLEGAASMMGSYH